jgi:hypothetical protein
LLARLRYQPKATPLNRLMSPMIAATVTAPVMLPCSAAASRQRSSGSPPGGQDGRGRGPRRSGGSRTGR